ncbi:MAG: hypothetical protein GY868_14615 [Deltaproteobacteria bacterium]|nr:hypothetical protein [Deltaproteobacteria bacterium]
MLLQSGIAITPAFSADEKPTEPHLLFKKTVVVREYQDGQAFTEPRRIQKGQHLWKILRDHYNLSNTKIAFYCEIAKAVNPDVNDLNKLYPNQKILVPFKYVKGMKGAADTAAVELHTMKSGEHLAHILRTRFNLPDTVIFSTYTMQMLKEANPDIVDLNRIAKGHKLVIPAELIRVSRELHKKRNPAKAAVAALTDATLIEAAPEKSDSFIEINSDILEEVETRPLMVENSKVVFPVENELEVHNVVDSAPVVAPKAPPVMSAPEPAVESLPVPVAEQVVIFDPAPEPLPPITPAPAPQLTAAARLPAEEKTREDQSAALFVAPVDKAQKDIQDMLSVFTRSFEGTESNSGKAEIPIQQNSSVSLDYSKFPVYEFPWGKKVLFDYGNRLPAGVKDIISGEWENAEIVSVTEKDDMDSVLDKVLDSCGFFKVEKNSDYMLNRENIQIKISGKWIVFKDNRLKNVFVVNLVNEESDVLHPELSSYLAGLGVKVVDIQPGLPRGSGLPADSADKKTFVSQKILDSAPVALTDRLLEVLAISFRRDYSTNIFQNMYSGFSMEVTVDRAFEKDGQTYIIDFHGLPERIAHIMVQQGYHLLQVDAQTDDFEANIPKILTFCGADFEPSPANFQYGSGDISKVKLSIPGYLVHAAEGDTLLTRVALQDQIVQFLGDLRVKIIEY